MFRRVRERSPVPTSFEGLENISEAELKAELDRLHKPASKQSADLFDGCAERLRLRTIARSAASDVANAESEPLAQGCRASD